MIALQKTFSELPAVAIDFETTGSTPGTQNVPWQIGVVAIEDGRVALEHSFHSLLHVPVDHPFNPYTPGRWGRLRKELDDAPTIQELWPELRTFLLGRILVAHHAPTERGLLAQEFPLQQFGPWVDTLSLARAAFPKQKEYKLETLIPALGMGNILSERCPGLAPHDAFYDAVACATFLENILSAPGWREISIERLVRMS